MPLLDATGLTRRFGLTRALRSVAIAVDRGEVVLLVGANGAGKTTLLRTLAGLVRPHRGRVLLDGLDIHRDPAARASLGFVSHHAMVYDDLTPRENLRFHATLHRLDAPEDAIAAALDSAGLAARADRLTRGFSRGMFQRLALARAALHQPELLLLDEPFSGLDANAAVELQRRLAIWHDQGRAIIAVSHDPAELWQLATRVVVMRAGEVVSDQPHPGDLAAFRIRLSEWLAP